MRGLPFPINIIHQRRVNPLANDNILVRTYVYSLYINPGFIQIEEDPNEKKVLCNFKDKRGQFS